MSIAALDGTRNSPWWGDESPLLRELYHKPIAG